MWGAHHCPTSSHTGLHTVDLCIAHGRGWHTAQSPGGLSRCAWTQIDHREAPTVEEEVTGAVCRDEKCAPALQAPEEDDKHCFCQGRCGGKAQLWVAATGEVLGRGRVGAVQWSGAPNPRAAQTLSWPAVGCWGSRALAGHRQLFSRGGPSRQGRGPKLRGQEPPKAVAGSPQGQSSSSRGCWEGLASLGWLSPVFGGPVQWGARRSPLPAALGT